MVYRLFFKKSVKKDLKRLGQEIARHIFKEIREKLLPDPRIGKPLKGAYSDDLGHLFRGKPARCRSEATAGLILVP